MRRHWKQITAVLLLLAGGSSNHTHAYTPKPIPLGKPVREPVCAAPHADPTVGAPQVLWVMTFARRVVDQPACFRKPLRLGWVFF